MCDCAYCTDSSEVKKKAVLEVQVAKIYLHKFDIEL